MEMIVQQTAVVTLRPLPVKITLLALLVPIRLQLEIMLINIYLWAIIITGLRRLLVMVVEV